MKKTVYIFLIESIFIFSLCYISTQKGDFLFDNKRETIVITRKDSNLLSGKKIIEETDKDEFFQYYRNDKDTLDYSEIWKLNKYLNSWKK